MIAHLRGKLLEKTSERIVLEAGGVGYEVAVNASTAARLPDAGREANVFVFESMAMYGGGVTLYGFFTNTEKQLFLTFKGLKATGAKKALEYLERAAKSLPDFRRAILDSDAKILKTLFGFTPKTAGRLIAGLKDKLGKVEVSGTEKLRRSGRAPSRDGALSQALHALSALGYSAVESRSAIEAVQVEPAGMPADVADIVRRALRKL